MTLFKHLLAYLAISSQAREHHILFFKLDHHVSCLPVDIPSLKVKKKCG